METKRLAPWALALAFAVLASSQVLRAAGGQKGQGGGIAISPTAPPPPAPPKPVRWQYAIQNVGQFSPTMNRGDLRFYETADPYNDMGKNGWELVGILPARTVTTPVMNGNTPTQVGLHSQVLIYKKPL